ncbi:hypothetical protein LTR62_005489 [Meristemomyces frigidus]|uniref:DUF7924 domain-containing protein n=1 Tax=Meristemomyces frigidus TaxID=1508187 RepID=A0AAN7TEK0_9PEZI|nr:hypothetical protein LTR62_005489 [Meristemomyces frigidus]
MIQEKESKQNPPLFKVQRSRGVPARQEKHYYTLPETDPDATGRLWTRVATKMSPKGRAPPREKVTKSSSSSRLPLRSAYTASDVDSVSESTSSPRSRALRPQQYSIFTQCILAPRRITVDAKTRITRGPFAHFGTERPASYRALDKLGTSSVLLNRGTDQAKEIAAHYDFMRAKRLCEAEFSTYAKETFFLGEPRSTAPPPDRIWRAERMLELVCPATDDSQWLKPPLLMFNVPRSDDYTWDVRPDCAYWISTRGFNEEYVHNIGGACFVYQDWVLCPYLTIEFKRDSDDISAAQIQAVTAGVIALYNRYQLHSRANPEVADEEIAATSLVHYTITFTGPCYTIFKIRPNDVDEPNVWNGCCMGFLDGGDCTHASHVIRLMDWINEIHRWGLTVHARACEMDVKRLLNLEGVDTSMIE